MKTSEASLKVKKQLGNTAWQNVRFVREGYKGNICAKQITNISVNIGLADVYTFKGA
jgi:hypothetical protein